MSAKFKIFTIFVILLFQLAVAPFASGESDYDFRKTRWGMTRQQVESSEKRPPMNAAGNEIYYDDRVAGYKAIVAYVFLKDQLVNAGYMFNEQHTNDSLYIINYAKVKDALIAKYGQPIEDEVIWKRSLYKDDPEKHGFAVSIGDLALSAKWETPETEIQLALWGDNYKINMFAVYKSKKLKHLIEKDSREDLHDKL